jgi:uncharacterized damage-inducible protein DinB
MMHPAVEPLLEIFNLNTSLFHHCIDGLSEEDARSRIDGRTNNVVFIALHLTDARFHLGAWLGLEMSNPFTRFAEIRHIDEMEGYPLLSEVVAAWDQVSGALEAHLPEISEERLQGAAPFELPVGSNRLQDTFAFMLQHEAYHIGQLSILRKQLGFEAMKWF